MTLSQMRYFQEVCRSSNITKAAQALHVSQPSISSAIRDLEDELGVNLFQRVKMRLKLTQEGEYFLSKVDGIIDEIDTLIDDMRDFSGAHNKIRIGVPAMIGSYLFPTIFNRFHAAYPDIRVDVIEQGSLRIREMVVNEELDLAFASADVGKDAQLSGFHLFDTELYYCVDSKHRLAKQRQIRLQALQGESVMLFQDGSLQNKVLMERFSQMQIDVDILMTTSQLYTIKRMIAQGNAGAFLFKEIAEMDPDFVGIPLVDPIDMHISLIWKKDRHVYSDAAKLIQLVKEVFRPNREDRVDGPSRGTALPV